MNLHDLPKCHLPKEQHEQRQQAHIAKGLLLEESVRSWDFDNDCFNVIADKPMMDLADIQMAEMYKEMPFGAANTVEQAGCVCFVSYYFLRDYNGYSGYCDFSFEEWVNEVVQKGYRAWKFRDYPGTFTSPKIDIEEVKRRFASKVDLTCCDTEEDLIAKLGPAEGIGGSMFLLDNVISILSENKESQSVWDTRLTSVNDIMENLSYDLYVPIRVNNAIYHNDPNRAGGHYVILYGVEDGKALIWDSSVGDVELPFKTLMEAAVKDKNLIAAWNIW